MKRILISFQYGTRIRMYNVILRYFSLGEGGGGLLPDPHLQASPLWGSQHGGPPYSDKKLPTYCHCYGHEGRREWMIEGGREGQRKGGKRDEVRWREEK